MTMFLIQSAILLAIAFIIGAIIGCLLKRMFGSDSAYVPAATAVAATVATAAVLAPKPAPVIEPELEPKPEPISALETVVGAPVAVAKPVPKPKAAPKQKVVATPKGLAKPVRAAALTKPDDLKLIVGIGPVNERKLNAIKITRFAQIAAWTPKDETSYGEKLEFPGRIQREEWVRQAKKLAAGGTSEDKAEVARKGGTSGSAVGLMQSASMKPSKLTKTKVESQSARPNTAASTGTTTKVAAPNTTVTKPTAKSASLKPAVTKPSALKPFANKPASTKKPMAAKLAKPIGGKPDNLTLIDGIGNVIEKKLHALGIFHFEQMSNWTEDQAETFSRAISFPGRAKREGWVKEAGIFAKGGTTDHARKVESGKIKSSRVSITAEKGGKKK